MLPTTANVGSWWTSFRLASAAANSEVCTLVAVGKMRNCGMWNAEWKLWKDGVERWVKCGNLRMSAIICP